MNKYCPQCGAAVPQDAKFCPECGAKLTVEKGKKVPEPAGRSAGGDSRDRMLLWAVTLVALVVVIIYVYPYFIQSPAPEHQHNNAPAANQPPPMDQAKYQELKAAVDANPNGPEENIQLANFLFDNHRFQEAINYYQKALRLDPRNVNVIVDVGVAYFNLQNYQEAEKYFQRALEIDPEQPNALYNLGIVRAQLGDMQGVIEVWNKLIKVAPESQLARNARQMLEKKKKSM